jgi:hypothetical protein
MAFVHLNTVTVDCSLVELDGGVAESGSVTFVAPKLLFDTVANQVITPTPITRQLAGTGEVTMTIPCCDDPDITSVDGQPWTYTVTISMVGVSRQTFYGVTVPIAASGTTLNLASLLLGASGESDVVGPTSSLSGVIDGGSP